MKLEGGEHKVVVCKMRFGFGVSRPKGLRKRIRTAKRALVLAAVALMIVDLNSSLVTQHSSGFLVCVWNQQRRGWKVPKGFQTNEPLFRACVSIMRMMKPILWVITRLFGTAIVCPACCLMFICCVRVFWCHLLLWYCVYYAAAILQILLLRGGVEPNLGPIMRVPTRDIEVRLAPCFSNPVSCRLPYHASVTTVLNHGHMFNSWIACCRWKKRK